MMAEDRKTENTFITVDEIVYDCVMCWRGKWHGHDMIMTRHHRSPDTCHLLLLWPPLDQYLHNCVICQVQVVVWTITGATEATGACQHQFLLCPSFLPLVSRPHPPGAGTWQSLLQHSLHNPHDTMIYHVTPWLHAMITTKQFNWQETHSTCL